MSVFSFIKNDIDSVVEECGLIKQLLEVKQHDRDEVANLPLPHEDFADLACEQIEEWSVDCSRRLEQSCSTSKKHFVEINAIPPILQNYGGGYKQDVIQPMNLYALLGPQIKEGVRKIIMKWDWPEKVGLPRSERPDAVAELDKEILELKIRQEELRGILDRASTELRQI